MASKNLKAFEPIGNTIAVAADTTAPTGVATVTTAHSAVTIIQFRIHNAMTVTGFYAYDTTAALATAAAVIPTGSGSNAKASYPIPPGAVEVISAPRDSYWSAITASGSGAIYITPCVGV